MQAAACIRSGGVVLHATEGVWGFACDPWNEQAVQQVLQIKHRAEAQGLILIGASPEMFAAELQALACGRRQQVLESWPGAVSWVLPSERFPRWVTGGRQSIAARVPGHAQARALASAVAGPLVSTSANRSGEPAATSEADARAQFADQVDVVVSGAVQTPGAPSQLRTLAGQVLRG